MWPPRGVLRALGVRARFALVGKPDPANPGSVSESEIAAWVAEGAVEYWGWRDDMPGVFAQAQIVCLPTYYGEGIPKSLLEAAASGCAIVASDTPGCREIVDHGVTGWLVPAQDVEALADVLQQAIERPDLRERYGIAARSCIATDFSMDRVIREVFAIYENLMATAQRKANSRTRTAASCKANRRNSTGWNRKCRGRVRRGGLGHCVQ